MKLLNQQKNIPLFFLFIVLIWGCKQPETVVIDDAPRTTAGTDTTEQMISDDNNDFQKLVIGEYQSISSFDPLLAENATTMRALQLVYEGLVRFDSSGDITTSIAKDWDISSDSLRYTFQLNRDTYYQDDEVFSTGTGRRLKASDVKFIFERMASSSVPPKAAKMFMDIRGFEPFFQEQHHIYIPEQRTLSGISGIQTPNDSTVVFQLTKKDSKFLEKLATPYAVIYPREAVNPIQNSFAAVGTGPFSLSTVNGDSLYIFSQSDKYRHKSQIQLDRVDIITGQSESQLLQQIGSGDIDVLPQLGPNMVQSVTNDAGNLKPSFQNQYDLHKRSLSSAFILYHNRNAPFPSADAQQLSALAYQNTSQYFDQLPSSIIYPDSLQEIASSDTTITTDQMDVVYSDNPFIRTYLGNLSQIVKRKNINLQMVEIRVPTHNTELYFEEQLPLINSSSNNSIFRFHVHHTTLQRNEIQNLSFNNYSWWVNLLDVAVPTTDN